MMKWKWLLEDYQLASDQTRRKTYGPGGIWTHDLAILGLLLYQLSYRSMDEPWIWTQLGTYRKWRSLFNGYTNWIAEYILTLTVRRCRNPSTTTILGNWPLEHELQQLSNLTILTMISESDCGDYLSYHVCSLNLSKFSWRQPDLWPLVAWYRNET